jgi:Short C-terminal domain
MRRTFSTALVVVGGLVGVLAILAIWVSRQALETDQWTDTSSNLLQDPAVQTVVAGYLVDQLYANVDVAAQLRAALPPRAQPLAAPAAGALRRGAEELAQRALRRPRVQAAWEQANRRAHAAFVQVVEGGGNVVSTDQGTVTLDLKALLDEVAGRTGVGARVTARLPDSAASIVILRSDQLSTIQSIGKALKPLALVLTLLALACFAGAIALVPGRRREALRASGWAFVLAGIAALAARKLAGETVVDKLATTASLRPAVESVWRIGTSLLVGVAVAAIAYGLIAVAGAWLAGPTRFAVRVRRQAAPYLRDPRVAYGALAAVLLLVLLWGPTEGTRRVLPALLLLVLVLAGFEVLRRQVRREAASAGPAAPTGGGDGGPSADDDALAQLERLAALHRSGQLDDAEFNAAKQRVLTPA